MRDTLQLGEISINYPKLKAGRPPVLLFGGLTQIWPLGFAGIPVILATAEPKHPALASRYIQGACQLAACRDSKNAILDTLLRLGRKLRGISGCRIPLFCGNDHDIEFTYEFHDALEEDYIPADTGVELGWIVAKKDLFEALAVKRSLPIPRTYTWDGDGETALKRIETPVIVKPRRKEAWNQLGGFQQHYHAKAGVFPNGAAVLAQSHLEKIKDRLFFQEYVPGSDVQIYSFHGYADRDGQLLAWFLGRKIRTFPMLTGESTFVELVKDDELFRTGSEVAAKLGLRGVFKIDFKKNEQTGRFYLLEINARFNLWHYLGAVNGVNLPKTAYEYLVYGTRPVPGTFGTGCKWNHFLLDCHAYRELRALGKLTFAAWARSLMTRRVQNVFCWKDPLPFLKWSTDYFSLHMRKWLATAF